MAAQVKIDAGDVQASLHFTDARIVTQTAEHVVVALENNRNERLLITLPKAMLRSLGDWRTLIGL